MLMYAYKHDVYTMTLPSLLLPLNKVHIHSRCFSLLHRHPLAYLEAPERQPQSVLPGKRAVQLHQLSFQ